MSSFAVVHIKALIWKNGRSNVDKLTILAISWSNFCSFVSSNGACGVEREVCVQHGHFIRCVHCSGDEGGQVLSEHHEVLQISASGQQQCECNLSPCGESVVKMIMVLMKMTMVLQVYRSVLISGRKRRHSGNSENSHRQCSPTEGGQEQGNTCLTRDMSCVSPLRYFGHTVFTNPQNCMMWPLVLAQRADKHHYQWCRLFSVNVSRCFILYLIPQTLMMHSGLFSEIHKKCF